MNETANDIAEFRLKGWKKDHVILKIPGTDYQLELVPGEGMTEDSHEIGSRVKGRVQGRALKMYRIGAGGNFIEPVSGHPRIVQGTVIASDPAHRKLLIDLVVPVWVDLNDLQSAGDFRTGDLAHFYMHTGTSFTPIA